MYDETSGQVFKEYTLSRRSLTKPDSEWRRRQYASSSSRRRSTNGPRSLVEMAADVTVNNIDDLTEEHVEAMAPRSRWTVWHCLHARLGNDDNVCLHVWKLFSKFLFQDNGGKTMGLYRYRQHICKPNLDLRKYTEPLTSLPTDFISHLVLSGGCEFRTNDLLCLTDMNNLGVLEIIQPDYPLHLPSFPEVTDRLIRGWTEKVNPFPLLRVLKIWGDQFITKESLQWVSKFPSLAFYEVRAPARHWPENRSEYKVEYDWELGTLCLPDDYCLVYNLQTLASAEFDQTYRYSKAKRPCTGRRIPAKGNINVYADRNIHSDLYGTCSNSQCALKVVKNDQTPRLMDYIAEQNKDITRSTLKERHDQQDAFETCHDAIFEISGFWLYSLIGQLSHDRDLKANGVSIEDGVVAGPLVLPSKQYVSLFLGHSRKRDYLGADSSTWMLPPTYWREDLSRITFIRRKLFEGAGSKKPKSDPTGARKPEKSVSKLRGKKRKHMNDVINGMM